MERGDDLRVCSSQIRDTLVDMVWVGEHTSPTSASVSAGGAAVDGHFVSAACIYLCRAKLAKVTERAVLAAISLALKQFDHDPPAMIAVRKIGLQVIGSAEKIMFDEVRAPTLLFSRFNSPFHPETCNSCSFSGTV